MTGRPDNNWSRRGGLAARGLLLCALASLLAGCGQPGGAETVPVSQAAPAAARRGSRATQPEHRDALLPKDLPHDTNRREPRPDDWFEDMADRCGISFAYHDASDAGFYQMLEPYGGGAALFDYDRDGDVDVFLTGGGDLKGPPIEVLGRPCALFRNDGDWHFTDVTRDAGLDAADLYTHGPTAADFDRDGWPDLFVAGFGGVKLYRNCGDGTFADVTESAGLKCPRWNIAGAWADVDRDGWLDLYVLTYADWKPDHTRRCLNDSGLRDVCGPTLFPGDQDQLFRNRGDGTFEEITAAAGLVPRNRGLGIVAADVNEDGWIDFFVGNDAEENQLYYGGPKLPFREEGVYAGVAFSTSGEREGTMGVDVGDFDGDGKIDLWWANFADQDNSLARKTADDGGFFAVGDVTGMVGCSRSWTGFGTGFADFDNDGWLDLFLANGHVWYESSQSPYFQPAQLFRNEDGRRFVEVTDRGGPYFSINHAGRGAAVGDLDNDGSLDLVISNQSEPVAVLRNRHPAAHWLRVELKGTVSNPDAVGARLTAPYGSRVLTRWIRGGGSWCSHFDRRVLFPAVDDSPLDVTVHWPAGGTEVFRGLQTGTTHELIEGTGQPR